MQGVGRILSGRDTEYEQLYRENLSTIATFGEAFMEVVCRDACDGHDIGRVSFGLTVDARCLNVFGSELSLKRLAGRD